MPRGTARQILGFAMVRGDATSTPAQEGDPLVERPLEVGGGASARAVTPTGKCVSPLNAEGRACRPAPRVTRNC